MAPGRQTFPIQFPTDMFEGKESRLGGIHAGFWESRCPVSGQDFHRTPTRPPKPYE